MTSLLVWILRTFGNRKVLEDVLFEVLETPPLRGLIGQDDNRRLTVGGKVISQEQLVVLRESAHSALNNQALKLIREQVRFQAIDKGFLSSPDPTKTSTFYKAALLYEQEERAILSSLAVQGE